MSRSYAHALSLLNTLQSNRAIHKLVGSAADRNAAAIPEMLEWVRCAGFRPADFERLRVIHVAGTKGKGSVCATVASILAQYQSSGQAPSPLRGKIGVFTSPHLVSVRERISIDGRPLDKDTFVRYFFDLWERFAASAAAEGHADISSATRPFYFRFLTIMALHAFVQEGVQTAIVECGIGGEYDSTNILTPATVSVSAISTLGIDHTAMLGDTIDRIAWHKAGIMKPGVPAFTAPQEPSALAVLRERATERHTILRAVQRHPDLDSGKVALGLEGDFQRDNASLAVAVSAEHLRQLGVVPDTANIMAAGGLPTQFVAGLESIHWEGRCQVEREDNLEWYIDGAHTMESMAATARWFASKDAGRAMLIFNQQDRDAVGLLRHLLASISQISGRPPTDIFSHAALSTNHPFPTPGTADDDCAVQWQMHDALDTVPHRYVCQSIAEAVAHARRIAAAQPGEPLRVLVTGSLYLVGGFLSVLRGEAE